MKKYMKINEFGRKTVRKNYKNPKQQHGLKSIIIMG